MAAHLTADRCITLHRPDGSVAHHHLFGSIDNLSILVQRIDTPDGTKWKTGAARAITRVTDTGDVGTAEWGRADRLFRKVAEFTGQRMGY